MPRGLLAIVVLCFVVVSASNAEATFTPTPIRLALLFDRPDWSAGSDPGGWPSWHVTERLER